MVLEESGHEDLKKRDRWQQRQSPRQNKSKEAEASETFYLSLIICLPQLILKNLLLQKGNFRTPDHHPTLGHLPLPRQTQGSVVSGS